MADLRVTVGGDSTGFVAELNKAKAEAAKFGQQVQNESTKQAAGFNPFANADKAGERLAKKYSKTTKKVMGVGGAIANVAGAADSQVANAVSSLSSGFFALQGLAASFGLSLMKAAGVVAVFAFSIIQVGRLFKEMYGLYGDKQVAKESEYNAKLTAKNTVL